MHSSATFYRKSATGSIEVLQEEKTHRESGAVKKRRIGNLERFITVLVAGSRIRRDLAAINLPLRAAQPCQHILLDLARWAIE